jgi:hypothetical protein
VNLYNFYSSDFYAFLKKNLFVLFILFNFYSIFKSIFLS